MDEETQTLSVEEQLKAISERLAATEAENKRLREDQLNMMLRQPPVNAVATQTLPTPPALSFDNLPDPVADREGYARAMAQRVAEHNEAVRRHEASQMTAQESAAQRDEAIIEDFKRRYPGYSVKGAQAVAAQVLAEKKARGLNVDAYVYTATDQFLQDVAAAYEAEFGKPAAKEAPKVQPLYASPEDEFVRTGGILGGRESGGAPATGPAAEVEGPSMAQILRSGQIKAGIVR